MDSLGSFSYTGLTASTLAYEPNNSYLSNTGHIPLVAPMSGPTMGLMMLLSTFQYQAPYMNGTYSNAASQAGKAAFIQSGGQEAQDKLAKDGTNIAHDVGFTDTELGIAGFTAKTVRNRQVNIKGPSIGPVKSNLTGAQNSGSIGFKYEW